MDSVVVALPFPPSTNTYYRKFRNRMVISDRGRAFKDAVADIWTRCRFPMFAGRVRVSGLLLAPDHRRRDIDNFFGKALFDSLTGLAWSDDSEIYEHGGAKWELWSDGHKITSKNGGLMLTIDALPTPPPRVKRRARDVTLSQGVFR